MNDTSTDFSSLPPAMKNIPLTSHKPADGPFIVQLKYKWRFWDWGKRPYEGEVGYPHPLYYGPIFALVGYQRVIGRKKIFGGRIPIPWEWYVYIASYETCRYDIDGSLIE